MMPSLNVLSQRYATPEINDIHSEKGKILSERELWIAVMKAQRELGVNIPAEDIEKFERSKGEIDVDWIQVRELEIKHDVKARIEAFVKVSGAGEHIHRGMTSRDLTDNVEQMQIKSSSEILIGRYASVLRHMMVKAESYRDLVITARTHHQAAQPTLLGRKFSMWGEELYFHIEGFENFISRYPLRGIKGPVGTQSDMLTLLGSQDKVDVLEQRVAKLLGFNVVLDSPGQVYPRSLDYAFLSHLSLLAASPENFAKNIRLMAGYELVTEGFGKHQKGSTAMPHKMNTRTSERVCSLAETIKGYVDMGSRLSGDQWEEGDVSCSALRRVAIPDSIFASDGLIEATLTVLNDFGAYTQMVLAEKNRYLPFLATTQFLTLLTKAGMGREEAHEVIRKYAVGEALNMRNLGIYENRLVDRLISDPTVLALGITEDKFVNAMKEAENASIAGASSQIDNVRHKAASVIVRHEEAAKYEPRPIR
jgi:adenylosuccinate lyase